MARCTTSRSRGSLVASACRPWRGADLVARVLLPRVADLMPLMPVKVPPTLSKILLCPTPGQRPHRRHRGPGRRGWPGLAIVEAMKMENVLKAEARSRFQGAGQARRRPRRR